MRFEIKWVKWILLLTAFCIVQCMLSGCAVVGPASISQGRMSYAEAINKTEDQQMLLSIVKGRYRESATLLTVNSVAANMRFRASADAEFAIGAEKHIDELVPLSTGIAYEENPTITYSPVRGEEYIRQLMSPVPLDILMLTLRSMTDSDHLLLLLVNRVNDLRNPDFLDAVSAESSQKFKRFVELFNELHSPGILDLLKNPQADVVFDLLISDYAPDYSAKVTEFLELLDVPMPADESKPIVIPVSFAIRTKGAQGIGIITRSTFDLVEIMRASIVVPQEHADAGLTCEYPPMGLPGEGIRINSSREKPNDMSLAVKYRDYWFCIDETDQITKGAFLLLRSFWSISITNSDIQNDAPVLTIPVSR